jgi:hypothetical protein
MTIKDITLEFSRSERLNEIFFCDKCSRTVLDFTDKTGRELDEALKKSPGNVCGRFKKSQMSDRFLKYAAAAVVVTSMAMPAIAQESMKGDSATKADEKVKVEEDVFMGTIVDTGAEPIGGMKAFMKEIADKIIWPPGLNEKGRSFVEITIDTTGQIQNVRLLKGFHELAGREAVRVLSSLQIPFHPARQLGKAVRSRLVIPVLFDPAKR